MAIGGIESVTYGVDDMADAVRFFEDFGLQPSASGPEVTIFLLEEGSKVILKRRADPSLPEPLYEGSGVREFYFSVDNHDELAMYAERVGSDRDVSWSEDGASIRFVADGGITMGLRVFTRKPVLYAPDPVNAPDNVKRLNQHRRWRVKARPKVINHIVWKVEDFEKSLAFFRERLDFRLTDFQIGAGAFCRAEGARQHHVIYFQKFDVLGPPPHKPGFDHLAFGVEDIDEVYAGWNYMERRGYTNPMGGVGRHRIASAIFCYFHNPAGGLAEYGADTDYLDDNWVPRVWKAAFGGFLWTSRVPPFLPEELAWEVAFDQSLLPQGAVPEKFVYAEDRTHENLQLGEGLRE